MVGNAGIRQPVVDLLSKFDANQLGANEAFVRQRSCARSVRSATDRYRWMTAPPRPAGSVAPARLFTVAVSDALMVPFAVTSARKFV